MVEDSRCRWEHEAVAWIQSELTPTEAARFEEHLEGCSSCRRFVRDGRRILAALSPRPVLRSPAWRAPAAAAAVLLTALLAVQLITEAMRSPPPAAGDAVAWIQARLGPDGTWDPALWKRMPGAAIGMHALATLALAESCAERADLRDDAVRAARWLVDRQGEDGGIGLPPHPLHHPVATAALVETWHATEDETVGRAAEAAVDYLVRTTGGAAPGGFAKDTARLAWTRVALGRVVETPGGEAPDAPVAPPAVAVGDAAAPAAIRHLALATPAPHAADAMGDLFAASVSVLAPSFGGATFPRIRPEID